MEIGNSFFVSKKEEGYRLYRWSARDNPYLTKEYLATLDTAYQGAFALQEIEGQFVPVDGTNYFKIEPLKAMLDDCRPPVESRLGGLVKVWRKPVVGARYIAGFDTAWGKAGSYSCLAVLDWQTGDQVAEIHGRPDLDELAKVAVDLCTEYNKAFVTAEWAGDENEGQYVINLMIKMGYSDRMFYRAEDKPGWVTDGKTRPLMLAELEVAVRNLSIRLRCEEAVRELMGFVRDEKGRPSATEGMHDDHVFAVALAWAGREYARIDSDVVTVRYHDKS